jgi:hypothetical protein
MKVNTTRLDMTNPFAQQQQMSAKVMNAINQCPTLTNERWMERLTATDNAHVHVAEISSVMTSAHPNSDDVQEMASTHHSVVLFRRRRAMRHLTWLLHMVLVGLRLGKSLTKHWRTSKKRIKRQLRQHMHRVARRHTLTSLKA